MSKFFNFSKLLLFTLDFLFAIIGLIVAVVGIWILVDSGSFFETIAFFAKSKSTILHLYSGTPVVLISSGVLIGIGSIVFIISFCACWGVISENRLILITYATLMSFIVFVEVICVILLFALNQQWQSLVNKKMLEEFSTNYNGAIGVRPISTYTPFSLALDAVMIQFKCCGINGPGDFQTANEWIKHGRMYIDGATTHTGESVKVPVACCEFSDTKFFKDQQYEKYQAYMVDSQCPLTLKASHNVSCANVIPIELERNKIPLIVTPVVILLLELLCIGLASYMAQRIKRYESAVFY